jgi:uracil-DNA glycosylase
MTTPTPPSTREMRASIDWWRSAGVDCDFADEAKSWLREDEPEIKAGSDVGGPTKPVATAEPQQSPATAPKIEPIDLLGDSPPQSLEQFRQFWLEAPGLDAIGPRGRIAPRGAAGAELMVMLVDPEETDRETVMSGMQGRFLARILSAMGLNDDAVYIASALPRHTPMADTLAIARSGMDRVALHHIGLVAPKRIITFGSGILPLIGHNPAQEISSLREINHGSIRVPLLASEGLDSLMSMPRLKAKFWRRWIGWSDET